MHSTPGLSRSRRRLQLVTLLATAAFFAAPTTALADESDPVADTWAASCTEGPEDCPVELQWDFDNMDLTSSSIPIVMTTTTRETLGPYVVVSNRALIMIGKASTTTETDANAAQLEEELTIRFTVTTAQPVYDADGAEANHELMVDAYSDGVVLTFPDLAVGSEICLSDLEVEDQLGNLFGSTTADCLSSTPDEVAHEDAPPPYIVFIGPGPTNGFGYQNKKVDLGSIQ